MNKHVLFQDREREYEKTLELRRLRDEFAMSALSVVPMIAKDVFQNPHTWTERDIADEAYRIADAMLEARKK